MKEFFVTVALGFFLTSFAFADVHELEGHWPQGGGNITVTPTGEAIIAGGIEFIAAEGIPTQGASAAPFVFFVSNSAFPGNVTFGSLGNSCSDRRTS